MYVIEHSSRILIFNNKTSSYYLKSVYLTNSIYFGLIFDIYIISIISPITDKSA